MKKTIATICVAVLIVLALFVLGYIGARKVIDVFSVEKVFAAFIGYKAADCIVNIISTIGKE